MSGLRKLQTRRLVKASHSPKNKGVRKAPSAVALMTGYLCSQHGRRRAFCRGSSSCCSSFAPLRSSRSSGMRVQLPAQNGPVCSLLDFQFGAKAGCHTKAAVRLSRVCLPLNLHKMMWGNRRAALNTPLIQPLSPAQLTTSHVCVGDTLTVPEKPACMSAGLFWDGACAMGCKYRCHTFSLK